MSLLVRPITRNAMVRIVTDWHRHHAPTKGFRFALGAHEGDRLVGVASVGRPRARLTDQELVAEVTRLCTDGTKNACSILYAAAARAADAMGFDMIQTFILLEEPGTSLLAAGWTRDDTPTEGGDWNRPSRGGRRTDQPQGPKWRWFKVLSNGRQRARTDDATLAGSAGSLTPS